MIKNPNEYIFYASKYQSDREKDIKIKFDEEMISMDFEKVKTEDDNKIITGVYFVKIDKSKKEYKIIINEKLFIKNHQNFIYGIDSSIIDNSEFELSDYELFQIYKSFIENKNIPELNLLFYENTYNYISSTSIVDFVLYMEILENYKENEDKLKFLFKRFPSIETPKINIKELKKNNIKYFDLINKYKLEKFNLSKINENMEKKGQLFIKIFLYICLLFEKFNEYYKNNKKKKEIINEIIHLNQTIEYIFLKNKIEKFIETTSEFDKVKSILKECKFYDNFLYILSHLIKNKKRNKDNIDIEKYSNEVYDVAKDDDLNFIKENYDIIKSKIPNFYINENIINKYFSFLKKNDIDKLIRYKNIFGVSKNLISKINECVQNILFSLKFKNFEICNFIQQYLNNNIDWLKQSITCYELINIFDWKNIDSNFIEEYRKLNLRLLFNKEYFQIYQNNLVEKNKNSDNINDIIQLIDFNFDDTKEKEYIDNLLLTIIINIIQKNEEKNKSLINILKTLVDMKIDNSYIEKFIKILGDNLPQENLIDLYIEILNNRIIDNKEINENILTHLNILSINGNKKFEKIISKLDDKQYLNQLLQFNYKNNKKPKENDFFIEDESEGIKFIKIILNNPSLKNNLLNLNDVDFGKDIIHTLENLQNKINNYEIKMDLADKILKLNNTTLTNRLKLILNKDDIEDKKEHLIQFIKDSKNIKANIDKIYMFLKKFFKHDKKKDDYEKLTN